MKQILLIIVMLFFSINLYSSTPDSCLKMIWGDDEIYYDTEYNHWVGSSNPDSVKVDSCTGSPTFGKLFAKRYFYLQFHPNYYPFDTLLKPDTIKGVADISSSKSDLQINFEQVESQFGTIYFQGLKFEENDSIALLNPVLRLFFAEYNDIQEVIDTFVSEIDTLKNIVYESRFSQVVSVKESNNENQVKLFSPNPVSDFIMVSGLDESKFKSFSIFNSFGQKLYEGDLKVQIDVSSLKPGVYFLQIGNMNYKFVKL